MKLTNVIRRGRAALQTPEARRWLTLARRLFLAVVLGWLFWQLSQIGWSEVGRSLPGQPLFYLLFLLIYFQLPFFEIVIYRISWIFRSLSALPAFLIKRVYNSDFLGYSGEFYLFSWARTRLGLDDREIALTIKDNNIISSIASTAVAFGLIAAFLFAGQIELLEQVTDRGRQWFWGAVTVGILIVALLVQFRNSVISMPFADAGRIFGIHIGRLLFLQTLNVLLYVVVIPDAPLSVWFTLIAIEIILSRIPFLPNRDLVFVGMGLGIAHQLPVTENELAGLLVAKAALGKGIGLIAFLGAQLAERSRKGVHGDR